MKKIYGFLGALAILSMVGCSKDDAGLGNGDQPSTFQGDMYMSIAIRPVGANGSRTATEGQGEEVGKDRENKISSALVVFAEKVGDDYKVVTSVLSGTANSDFQLTGNPQSNYMATFLVDRNVLLNNIKGGADGSGTQKDYYIFVIANPGSAASYSAGDNLQKEFTTSGDVATYWQADNFLMSNSGVNALTIEAEKIKKGTHTEATDPFELGTVEIQRAMSRFDLATASKYTKFTATNEGRADDGVGATGNSDLEELTLTFDAVAMINMAQKANLFKVTAASKATLGEKKISFMAETVNNWVFSPVQTAFSAPLFSGAPDATGLQGGSTVTEGIESFFATQATEDATNHLAVNRVGGYTTIANLDLSETENQWSKDPSDKEADTPVYKIWRYCMENTNPDDVANQKNGNSTGVVFRAEITGKKVDGTALSATDGALYAYNSVIIGNAVGLRTYVISPKDENDNSGVYDAVKLKYESAVAKYNAAQGEDNTKKFTFEEDKTDTEGWSAPAGSELEKGYKDIRKASAEELAGLDTYLVKNGGGFSIYRPTSNNAEGKYYCYYIYWNRHNDNGNNSEMGPMEFATVRNNIYKLRVTHIHKLGHPGKPEDDPDDPKPEDPDEKDKFYCQVICKILPWEVRLNDIEF